MDKILEEIKNQAQQAALELCETAKLKSGDIMVVGCSSSEVSGGVIGKNSSLETAQAVFDGIYEVLKKNQYGQCLKDVLDGKYQENLY